LVNQQCDLNSLQLKDAAVRRKIRNPKTAVLIADHHSMKVE